LVCTFYTFIFNLKFRIICILGQSNWLSDGISLVDSESKKDIKLPLMSDFHSAFQVVFVDSSGYLNLCANVFKSNYIHVSLNL